MRRVLRRSATAALLAAAMLLLAVPAMAAEIGVSGDGPQPQEVAVEAGETIVWRNDGAETVTVVADDGSWDSGPLAPGQTYSLSLPESGRYVYRAGDARGTVIVDAGDDEPRVTPIGNQPDLPNTGAPLAALAAGGGLLVGAGTLLVRRGR